MPEQTVAPFPDLIALSPAACRVLDAISGAGGRAFLVGGCVRDAVRNPGQQPKDVDIEVFGLSAEVLGRALCTVGPVEEVGRSFAVLTMRVGGQSFDVSLPRREIRTGPGHRDFTVAPDPHMRHEQAAARRDYTVNSLMYDPTAGTITDPFGGLRDLEAGVLRHTGPAFTEDALRVLRGVGFAARFGFRMHPATVDLCRSLSPEFAQLSTERIWTEWHKIATRGTHLPAALDLLAATGWDAHFPELATMHGVEQDPSWHPEGDVFAHSALAAGKAAHLADEAGIEGDDRAVVVLAALCHDMGKVTRTQRSIQPNGTVKITSHGHDSAGVGAARAFLTSIGAPRALADRVIPLVAEHMVSTTATSVTKSAVRRLARRLVPATISEWALVSAADQGGRAAASRPASTGQWLELAADVGTLVAPVTPLLRGRHLIAAGLQPGPQFTPILAAALAAQDEGAYDDEDGAVEWLGRHLATHA